MYLFKVLLLSLFVSGCATDGFYYVESETVTSVLVRECKLIVLNHSEEVQSRMTKTKCRKFFMNPHQMSSWKALQKSLKERDLDRGIELSE